MEKQISAVEWLENEFQEMCKDFGGIDTNWIKRFEQAKQMEKEQIVDAFSEGTRMIDVNDEMSAMLNGFIYYGETYEQDKQG